MSDPTPEDHARQIIVAEDNRPARGDPHAASVMLAALCPECLTDAIATAIREAEARGERRGIERARQRIDSVRFERYAVAEPGAQYKWQAALELADDVRAIPAAGEKVT